MKASDVSEMKARQCAKIKELRKVLIATGFRSLDEQAKALGLSRSTTWTLIKASHKNSGLSASIINRILARPQLPPLVRAIVVEYVEDKSAGLYGHNKISLRRFNCAIDSSVLPATKSGPIFQRQVRAAQWVPGPRLLNGRQTPLDQQPRRSFATATAR
jgi:predicted DNA-binding transcriptional regulator AlpA